MAEGENGKERWTTEDRVAAAVFFVLGLIALAYTIPATYEAVRLTWWGARAVAVAVPAWEGQEEGADTSGKPTMQFPLPSGEVVRFRQAGFGPQRVGMAAEVVYDPADPAGTARIAGGPLWVIALWGLPMGIGFTLLPWLGIRFGSRRWRW